MATKPKPANGSIPPGYGQAGSLFDDLPHPASPGPRAEAHIPSPPLRPAAVGFRSAARASNAPALPNASRSAAPQQNRPSQAAPQSDVTIRGRVDRIIWEKPEDSFYIFVVQPFGTTSSSDAIKVKGYAHNLTVSQEVDCSGVWESSKNPKYKDELTLKATSIADYIPTSKQGLQRMLENGFVKGIGAKWAEALVEHFGPQLLDVAERSPIRLLEVSGFGDARAQAFARAVKEKRAVPRIMAYLADIGLGPGLSHRVFKELGVDAVRAIQADPYALTKVQQIGFAIADKVAQQIGVPPDSTTRIEAGCRAVLLKEAECGSTVVPAQKLLTEMSALLAYQPAKGGLGKVEVPMPRIGDVLSKILQEGVVAMPRVLEGNCKAVSLPEYLYQERSISAKLTKLCGAVTKKVHSVDLSSPKFAHLDRSQLAAVRMALTSNVSVITGRPGCGKTTVTKSIIQALHAQGKRVLCCAPTGRAAKRFMEATGFPATTMHRALELRGADGFGRNEGNPLFADFVIADEQSMADTHISHSLLRAISPGTQLLYVGDVDQLPSIGAGAVLKDIIQSQKVPVSVLAEVHRQAKGSKIITSAHNIIEGVVPDSSAIESDFRICPAQAGDQVEAVVRQYEALLARGFLPEDIQILTPMRKKTDLGSNELNRRLKAILNPGDERTSIKCGRFESEITFSPGDRVMYVANNRDLGIYNGDIGYIKSIDKIADEIIVDFSGDIVSLGVADLDDLDLACATTIHKSQGSEFPAVIIPLSKSHWMMWDRNLLYTAVTRGKTEVVLTGDTYMLKSVVEKHNASSRQTGLGTEMRAAFSANRQEYGVDDVRLLTQAAAAAAGAAETTRHQGIRPF